MSKIKNKNTTIKILAFLISILLWSYVRNEVNPKIVREFKDIDVDIINERLINDEGLVISEVEDLKVTVKVSGRRSDLNSIREKDIIAEIDLSGAIKGTQRISVEVKPPFNVEIVDLSKRYIALEIDSVSRVEKQVRINTPKSSSVDIIEESLVEPRIVEVSGPSRLVKQVSAVTVDVDLTKVNTKGKMKLPVKAVDKKGVEIKGLKMSPSAVEVTLSVKKVKKVSINPKIVGSLSEEYKLNNISSNPATIIIRGSEKDIRNINSLETEKINVSGLKGNKILNVKLILPLGVTIDNGKDEVTITLTIGTKLKTKDENKEDKEKEKTPDAVSKEIKVPLEQVKLQNAREDLVASFADTSVQNISVTVRGEEEKLKNLTSADLNVSLKLDGLEEGIHDVNLVASTSHGNLNDIDPKSIKVKIEKIEKVDNIEEIKEAE